MDLVELMCEEDFVFLIKEDGVPFSEMIHPFVDSDIPQILSTPEANLFINLTHILFMCLIL